MSLDDYTPPPPTTDYTPRPNASQEVARAKRARGDSEPPAPADIGPIPRQWLVAALFGGMLLFIAALSWQLATPARPLALTPVPTEAPTESASSLSVKRAQEGPQETISATITPSRDFHTAVPIHAAPVGRGLGIDTVVPVIVPEPSYVANVGAQAPHVIRGGVTGPCDGACSIVPTVAPAMLEVIGRQAPHKVR